MPRRLLDRCNPDSIREFRVAAQNRYNDALMLAVSGRRTGAIYVWGYVAEMILKAAYFAHIGLPESTPISWTGHLSPAIDAGRNMGIAWPRQGSGHNVRAWAELLILTRAASPISAYPVAFGLEVQRRGQRIGQLWSETLRYHKNHAYLHEVSQVREATEWLLINSKAL